MSTAPISLSLGFANIFLFKSLLIFPITISAVGLAKYYDLDKLILK